MNRCDVSWEQPSCGCYKGNRVEECEYSMEEKWCGYSVDGWCHNLAAIRAAIEAEGPRMIDLLYGDPAPNEEITMQHRYPHYGRVVQVESKIDGCDDGFFEVKIRLCRKVQVDE